MRYIPIWLLTILVLANCVGVAGEPLIFPPLPNNAESSDIEASETGAETTTPSTDDADTVASNDAGPPIILDVSMNDLYYGEKANNLVDPPVWNVSAGRAVVLNLSNLGNAQHSWAIFKTDEKPPIPFELADHADLLLFNSGEVDVGSQSSVTFTAPDAGLYTVICVVSGHYPVMQGRLEVE